ncbi:MAG: uL15 family ribosomal protein [Candidatus Thermoplasmatota archaeon]|nr:uL15 family ribosomal protein [Candidatus Thermoplasmatota archaeon]MCL5730549.1 uL15 family ribosomal protein [Candidatus Thermoplasmatota archaeon]
MVRTRTKKYRGTHYGRGMKAGRGKGKKGGSGMAGLGKHRWIWMVKYDPLHYGGKGFSSHHFKKSRPSISLGQLSSSINDLRLRGFVTESDGIMEIDLKTAGYGKLLGSGDFRHKAKIMVPKATEKALNKVSSTGSTVELDE